MLIERLVDDATDDGAHLVVLFTSAEAMLSPLDGFEVIPTRDPLLTVAESARELSAHDVFYWRSDILA